MSDETAHKCLRILATLKLAAGPDLADECQELEREIRNLVMDNANAN